jgi:hypothetical protein
MGYTDRQIKSINEQANARPGHKYVTNSGKVYEGTANNRLKEVSGIDVIATKKEIKSDGRLDDLEKNIELKDDIVDVDNKLSKLECKMIAMNIVLG